MQRFESSTNLSVSASECFTTSMLTKLDFGHSTCGSVAERDGG